MTLTIDSAQLEFYDDHTYRYQNKLFTGVARLSKRWLFMLRIDLQEWSTLGAISLLAQVWKSFQRRHVYDGCL